MMNCIMKAAAVLLLAILLLGMAGAAPSYSKGAMRSTCPKGYSPLGEICLDKVSGDIVLPTRKTTDGSAQAITAR